MFYYLFTKRESPLEITLKSFKNKINHKVKIDLKLLKTLTIDTDSILLVDLIKRMIQEVPDQRETCEDLIDHAALKSIEERLQIVQFLAGKCIDDEFLVKLIDKREVHMEGFLGEDSAAWKEVLAEAEKYPKLKPTITTCSSLLKIFSNNVIKSNYLCS